jgi:alcohol dehydrogenase class IV
MAHGLALSTVLPHVVRWNAPAVADRYALLASAADEPAERLARDLEALALAGGLGGRLRDRGVTADALPELAQLAAAQWTGTFNPRPFDAAGAQEIYSAAF